MFYHKPTKEMTCVIFSMFSFRMYFDPVTGDHVVSGDVVQYRVLASTLRTIANTGEGAFYDGVLSDDIVADIREHGECGQ